MYRGWVDVVHSSTNNLVSASDINTKGIEMKVIESKRWDRDELKVCPMCGGDSWVYHYYDEDDFELFCVDCNETF